MHVITETDGKITVKVVVSTRTKEGALKYETFDSFDVGGATPEAVFAAAKEGVLRASAPRPAQK